MSRSDNSSKGCKSYPHRGRGFSRDYKRPAVKRARRAVRLALRAEDETGLRMTWHHRHSALWDRF